MKVWEITNDWLDKVAMLVVTDEDKNSPQFWDQFGGNGAPLHWAKHPKLQVYVDKKRKKPKPRADISPFTPEGLVLNGKARDALGDFLIQFGQLLELDVEGHVEYYYNVTRVISCVDRDRSEVLPGGYVKTPVFKDSSVPEAAAVFRDSSIPTSIYANDKAKAELEQRIAKHGITGMSFKQVWGDVIDKKTAQS